MSDWGPISRAACVPVRKLGCCSKRFALRDAQTPLPRTDVHPGGWLTNQIGIQNVTHVILADGQFRNSFP